MLTYIVCFQVKELQNQLENTEIERILMQHKLEKMEQKVAQLMRQVDNPSEIEFCCCKHLVKHVSKVHKPNCLGEILDISYHFGEVLDIWVVVIILLKYLIVVTIFDEIVLNCFYIC